MPQHGKHVVASRTQGIEAGTDDAEILGAIERAQAARNLLVYCGHTDCTFGPVVGRRQREVTDGRLRFIGLLCLPDRRSLAARRTMEGRARASRMPDTGAMCRRDLSAYTPMTAWVDISARTPPGSFWLHCGNAWQTSDSHSIQTRRDSLNSDDTLRSSASCVAGESRKHSTSWASPTAAALPAEAGLRFCV